MILSHKRVYASVYKERYIIRTDVLEALFCMCIPRKYVIIQWKGLLFFVILGSIAANCTSFSAILVLIAEYLVMMLLCRKFEQ